MIICPHTIAQINAACKGLLMGEPHEGTINFVITDSRVNHFFQESVFIAIKTQKNDGHNYIDTLYKKGLKVFLVNQGFNTTKFPDATFIIVDDTLKALQRWAKLHRSKFNLPVIAITGSNGKTIVKELLAQLLIKDYNIVRSPKSYNSQLGVPLSLLQIEEKHQLAIIETGISKPGEMSVLQPLVKPTIGIFTNALTAHLSNFKNHEELIKEKAILFKEADKVLAPNAVAEILDYPKNYWVWSENEAISPKAKNIFSVKGLNKANEGISIFSPKQEYLIQPPYRDLVYRENATVAAMLCIMLKKEKALENIPTLKKVNMRLELIKGIGSNLIINDAYSNDLSSFKVALDYQDSQNIPLKHSLLFSDLPEPGNNPQETYSQLIELINHKKLFRVIGVGENLSNYKEKIKAENTHFFKSQLELGVWLNQGSINQELLLVKGGRNFQFEKAINQLQAQGHETVLEINLTAMEHNLNVFKSTLNEKTGLIAMVKAFGYGTGAAEVADMLAFNRVDYLAVAYTDEAVALRKAGNSLPIMIMSPHASELETILKYNLQPVIFNLRLLDSFIERLSQQQTLSIHLKIETGLNRLGFQYNELDSVVQKIKSSSLNVATCFSHLAASGDENHDRFTRKQNTTFLKAFDKISAAFSYTIKKHILNSDGITRFPEFQYDFVRLGIGLHGVSSHKEIQQRLETTATFKTKIIQIKHLQKGDSCGYGRAFIASQDTTIAVIPVGYADGLSRILSNGKGYVFVNGAKANIIGNICMDLTMIDVTNIAVNQGDEVEIFGKNISLKALANLSNTIPYEVLTNISARVKRIYIRD
jgi:alanine racemase